jgi:ribonuclease P protein subunit RPR2
MAKGKSGGGVQNRAIYSRISFLQQAAVTLSATAAATQHQAEDPNPANATAGQSVSISASDDAARLKTSLEAMSRRLATDLRAVSLKTRIRLQPAMKQTLCKFCDSILIDGESCTSTIENKSKGARKPWADVLVRKCHTCARERRYPVSAARPRRKTERGRDGDSSHLQKQTQKG